MTKKILAIVLAAIIALSTVVVAFAVGTPTITVSSTAAAPGDTVTLDVALANNPGINTFSLGFDYDASKLELLNVTVNENLGGQFVYKKKAVWLNSKDTQYNGDILTLQFAVLESAKSGDAEVNVTYLSGDISNYNEEDVNFKTIAGKITIEADESNVGFIQKILNFFSSIINAIKNLFVFK